jgi:flagellar protein FliL
MNWGDGDIFSRTRGTKGKPLSEAVLDIVAEDIPEAAPAAKKPRFSKKMLIIIGVVVALLLVGGGAAYMMLSGGAPTEEVEAEADAGGHGEGGVSFVEAPPMVVNLREADGSARFLKIRFTLVPVNPDKAEELKKKLPLIVDAFQPFLRELRPEDLNGSAAVFRIKEEMLVRATQAVGRQQIKDILIQDLIQQ